MEHGMGSPSSKDKKPRARLASKGRGDVDKVGRRTEGASGIMS